jgi:hypothetical protein
MKFKSTFLLLIAPIAFALNASRAQNSMVVVQAASPAPIVSTSTTTSPTAPNTATAPELVKLLEAMKATNAETLKKQEAVLQQLDEIAKAAEQMKTFSKRG